MTSHSRLQVGSFIPLKDDGAVDSSRKCIPIYEGLNLIGRSDIPSASKQVSRKHLTVKAGSDGTFEMIVEGENPVVLRSGSRREKNPPKTKRLFNFGDIVELLPGKHLFMLISSFSEASDKERSLPTTVQYPKNKQIEEFTSLASAENELTATESNLLKRKSQELEDEAFARALQAVESADIKNIYEKSAVLAHHDQNKPSGKSDLTHAGANENADIAENLFASTFRLLRVRGLPNWANAGCVGLRDIIQGDVQLAIISDYMVDIDWMISACPLLKHIPKVVIIHGESGASLERLKETKPYNWILHKPPLPISYGTHHSKAMLLIFPKGLRVVVHTANMIYVDWNNKTQGLWMQDFPYKTQKSEGICCFENDLVEYLEALQWSGCKMDLPNLGNVQINAAFFRKFDFCSATVRLVASVPGYHQGQRLTRWGHMKLRTILREQKFENCFVNSPLVCQFSSLGSLDEKWLSEFSSSMCEGLTEDQKPLGLGRLQILWPTVEDVRWSLEGYAAGNAIPSPLKNVDKKFLCKYWARWEADHTGRSRAMPHIKTFVRYNGKSILWFLLTSSNLSKAAWGALQKNGSQLMIRSYELGVLFLPPSFSRTSVNFSCTDSKSISECISGAVQEKRSYKNEQTAKLVTSLWESSKNEDTLNIVSLPVPYMLPPKMYEPQDVPWSWDRQYNEPDVYGECWPRSVLLYGAKQN